MDKTNNDVKQEHYVPKSYLAWFADDHGKINVYDYKKMEYRKKQSIEKIAKIGGFYDFDENNLEYMKKFKEDIDKQYIEKMFSHNIEPALKDIIEKLSNLDIGFLDSCPSIKNHTLKLNISYLLVFQFLRTRSYRDFFENLLDDSKAAAFEQKKMLLDQESIDNLANYICNMSWTFCFNMSKVPYITSDNPVVIADYDFNYGHTALISKKKKNIQYPLSPQILLQIFDDGRLTDAQGRTVNFKNTVIIMTSNIGARLITDKTTLGFSAVDKKDETQKEYESIKKDVMGELKKQFRPEFINRIDEIIVFHKLNNEDIKQIIDIMINQVTKRMQEKGYNLEIEDSVKELIAKKGIDTNYGARPLKRAIQNILEDRVAEEILDGNIKQNKKAIIKAEDDKIVIK